MHLDGAENLVESNYAIKTVQTMENAIWGNVFVTMDFSAMIVLNHSVQITAQIMEYAKITNVYVKKTSLALTVLMNIARINALEMENATMVTVNVLLDLAEMLVIS